MFKEHYRSSGDQICVKGTGSWPKYRALLPDTVVADKSKCRVFTLFVFLPNSCKDISGQETLFLAPVLRESVSSEQYWADSLCPSYPDRPCYPVLEDYCHRFTCISITSILGTSSLASLSSIVGQFLLKESV